MTIDIFDKLPNRDWFLPDLYTEFQRMDIFIFWVHAETPMFEDFIHFRLLKHDVWAHIELVMLVDLFEDGWVFQSDDLFGFYCLEIFVAFHLFDFVWS